MAQADLRIRSGLFRSRWAKQPWTTHDPTLTTFLNLAMIRPEHRDARRPDALEGSLA
jgi:hypothetical protein